MKRATFQEKSLSLENRRSISFTLGDDESMKDMLITLNRGDRVVGYFIMDYPHWPFQPELLHQGSTWMRVIDILYELGCWLEEEERRHAETQHG
jgi:hypothetical protein